ncbi:sialate O-acetylesterase [Paenibacillus solanacearum]|nr:sialate O-acetylesterase [Paenibacillus solanacearum]
MNLCSMDDRDGKPVWSLIKPYGSKMDIVGERGLLFSGQTGPAYAGLLCGESMKEDDFVFETSFQIDRLGAVLKPMVMIIPRTMNFEQMHHYAIQYVLDKGRLKWRLINSAAPAAFNNAAGAGREIPYLLRWGQTYTASILIRNTAETHVHIQFYLDDPENPETGKKPLIDFIDRSPYRILRNRDVGPQVGASGSPDVQPSVLFSGMRLLTLEQWDRLKSKPSIRPQDAIATNSVRAVARDNENAEKLALPTLFSDHMVLQRRKSIPVWGKGKEGERVFVSFAGQTAETTVHNGKWLLKLDPVEAGGPYEMTVHSKEEQITLRDVLVGEVWVLSGQSNMEFSMKRVGDPADVVQANYPRIRLFTSRLNMFEAPQWDIAGGAWTAATPEMVSEFPAAGFYFGLELHQKHHVPIGLIATAVGGTDILMWMSGELVKELSLISPVHRQRPNYLYNARIAPLQPFAIAGVAWWQGEHNASNKDKHYSLLFSSMINDWRKRWGQGDFPFLYVQLSSYNDVDFPALRDEQLMTLTLTKNTGMAVTMDNGEITDIHPRNKKEAGYRLSLMADALAYGKPVEYMGPIYKDMVIKGNRAFIRFEHIGSGLMVKGEKLKGFTISGSDHAFVDADVWIEGDEVVVFHETITDPVAVRYAYEGYPEANLFNREGLPASPFRTDRS